MKKRHQAVRLAIFNHKGGVGKTTLTINVAAALAEQGACVVVIDSDPQCNITSYVFADTVVDDLLDTSDSPNGRTIWSAVKPIVEAEGSVKQVELYPTPTEGLYIVPGDIRLSEFEIELADYWAGCFQRKTRGFKGSSALSGLANWYAEKYGADYIFYDTGPNIGPLNRVILLDCDCFIVPGACDLFSVRALKTLGHTLVNWIRDWQTIESLAPDGAPLLPGKPRYLGYIPQGFRVYGQVMVRWSRVYWQQFEKQLYSDVVRPLRGLDTDLASRRVARTQLGQVKHFSSLVQQAQQQGVPLWQVTGGPKRQLREARDAFSKIAKEIMKRTARG